MQPQSQCIKDQQFQMQSGYQLNLKSITWKKSSHGLFDYDLCKDLTKSMTMIPMKIIKNIHQILIYRNHRGEIQYFCCDSQSHLTQNGFWAPCMDQYTKQIPKFNRNMMLQILGKFEVAFSQNLKICKIRFKSIPLISNQFNQLKQSHSQVYINENNISAIVRSFKSKARSLQGYSLKTGQTLKLGRVQMQVKVFTNQNSEQNQSYFPSQLKQNFFKINEQKVYNPHEHTCKICLSHSPFQQKDEYFFCEPCKCSGSMGLVHFQCLKEWWQHRKRKNYKTIKNLEVWDLRKYQCQICKADLIEKYQYKGKKYKLQLSECQFQKPYLCLSTEIDNQQSMYFISHNFNQEFFLGRSNRSQLCIPEKTVSRTHAQIKFEQGQFRIYDHKSRYGTLISEPTLQIEIMKNKRAVQIDSSIITFSIDCPKQQKQIIDIDAQL